MSPLSLPAAGLATSATSAAPDVKSTDPDEASTPGAAIGTAPVSGRSIPTASSAACRAEPLANVYHPQRLEVINGCITVSGTVDDVRHESDSDFHIGVRLDQPFANLVNNVNAIDQFGDLVVEIVPADEPSCTVGQPPRPTAGTYDYGICSGADLAAPAVGAHVAITGPYVFDHAHGWMEIHPAWAITPATVAPSSSTNSTMTAPPAGGQASVTITSISPNPVRPGQIIALHAVTSVSDQCDLSVTLPSGAQSQSRGLGSTTADATGHVTWTWQTGTHTKPGPAMAHVACRTGGSGSAPFQLA